MNCRTVFDLIGEKEKITALEKEMSQPGFWDRDDSHLISKEFSERQSRVTELENVQSAYEELETLLELIEESDDSDLQAEFEKKSSDLKVVLEESRLRLMLNEQYDEQNAILSIHGGAGGLDSQDWAEMLYRMYQRWAERHEYRIRILDLLQDEEAGIKNVTLLIEGNNVHGYLKSERGVHRLVRISPFDTAKRRHTSFASVDVSPDLPDDVEVEIKSEDIRVDTFRASGAGGQHVNMTDSAVRITHYPTGIVVSCQNERSQHMNRSMAMQILRSKIYEKMHQERRDELDSLQEEKKDISWGNQIRSYVLHPYTMVKDHRTGYETGNVQAVLDGDIDNFIMSYLLWRTAK